MAKELRRCDKDFCCHIKLYTSEHKVCKKQKEIKKNNNIHRTNRKRQREKKRHRKQERNKSKLQAVICCDVATKNAYSQCVHLRYGFISSSFLSQSFSRLSIVSWVLVGRICVSIQMNTYLKLCSIPYKSEIEQTNQKKTNRKVSRKKLGTEEKLRVETRK